MNQDYQISSNIINPVLNPIKILLCSNKYQTATDHFWFYKYNFHKDKEYYVEVKITLAWRKSVKAFTRLKISIDYRLKHSEYIFSLNWFC
jgi:hypothetical protein